MLAGEIRKQHRLPADGRRALANLSRLEEVYRKALSPRRAELRRELHPGR